MDIFWNYTLLIPLNAKAIQSCCPSYATKAVHLTSCMVQNQIYYKWAIMNDRKWQSSAINVLCDDAVLFRPSGNQFRENLKTLNRMRSQTREQKWPCFFVSGVHKNEAQSPWKKLGGRPIFSLHKKCWFLVDANEIRMYSLIQKGCSLTGTWHGLSLRKDHFIHTIYTILFLATQHERKITFSQ